MKIAVVGGGPAGLYFAILTKKATPSADVTVYERNRADDTFGFGVVFSDATLGAIDAADPVLHEAVSCTRSAHVHRPTCTAILRPGYRVGDRLLRPAQAEVAEPPARR